MKKLKKIGVLVLAVCLLITCTLPATAAEKKKLYFEEKNGKMVWNPVRGNDGNWFMSFTNMVPGGKYKDGLQIENGSRKTYKLYMQVIPVQQDERKDELLDLISMRVLLDGKQLYAGTASGKEYENVSLQNIIYLGTYEPGVESEITVDLELNKEIGIEYCDLLAKNDWKFMVTEVKNSGKQEKPQTINRPKTGDIVDITRYVRMMFLSLMLAGIIVSVKRIVVNKKLNKTV